MRSKLGFVDALVAENLLGSVPRRVLFAQSGDARKTTAPHCATLRHDFLVSLLMVDIIKSTGQS